MGSFTTRALLHDAALAASGGGLGRKNVESQEPEPYSILNLYKRLLALRRSNEALRTGRYETLTRHDDVFGFARSSGQEKLIVLLNFSEERRCVSLERLDRATLLLSTTRDRSGEKTVSILTLDRNEAVIMTEES